MRQNKCFSFLKWIEDYTRYFTATVQRMLGELQFVSRVAKELFIASTIVKPKKIHPTPLKVGPPSNVC